MYLSKSIMQQRQWEQLGLCVCMWGYLSQGSWACDHLGCYWLLSQQVWAACVFVCVCVHDLPSGVSVTKRDKNHGCTQLHIPSFSLLEPEPFSPALPPRASSCHYITACSQRHMPGGENDCHVPQRSTLYELLLTFLLDRLVVGALGLDWLRKVSS